MSEDLNEQVIVAFFESAEKADAAADALINWDKANDDIKLGTVGRITHGDEGKLETKHYGNSHSRRGALIGGAVGLVAAGMTGGLSLLVGTLGGGALGGFAGKLTTDHLGLADSTLQNIEDRLAADGAALVALCDDFEVNPTVAELTKLGGDAHSFGVSAKVLSAIHEANVNQMRDSQTTHNIDMSMGPNMV